MAFASESTISSTILIAHSCSFPCSIFVWSSRIMAGLRHAHRLWFTIPMYIHHLSNFGCSNSWMASQEDGGHLDLFLGSLEAVFAQGKKVLQEGAQRPSVPLYLGQDRS